MIDSTRGRHFFPLAVSFPPIFKVSFHRPQSSLLLKGPFAHLRHRSHPGSAFLKLPLLTLGSQEAYRLIWNGFLRWFLLNPRFFLSVVQACHCWYFQDFSPNVYRNSDPFVEFAGIFFFCFFKVLRRTKSFARVRMSRWNQQKCLFQERAVETLLCDWLIWAICFGDKSFD